MRERLVQLVARELGNGITWIAGLAGFQELSTSDPDVQALVLSAAGVVVGLAFKVWDLVIHKAETGGVMTPAGQRKG